MGDAPKVSYASEKSAAFTDGPTVFSLWGNFEQAVKETTKLALEQNPQARSVFLIEGNNEDSRELVGMLRKRFETTTDLPVQVVSQFSLAELKKRVAGLNKRTIVFCSIIWSDSTGARFIPRQVAAELAAVSPAPLYTFWSPFIGSGIIGGHMLDSNVVGAQLMVALLDYLKNGHFEDSYNTLQTYLDWDAMQRYDINADTVPAGAIVINKPPSLWDEYYEVLIEIGIALALLMLSAFVWGAKVARLNSKLRHSRDTLELRVAERTAELHTLNKDLSDSEARFRSLSDASFECIFITRNGVVLEANRAVSDMFGYEQDECIGMLGADMVAPDYRDDVMNNMLSGYEEPYESCCLHKDGSVFPVEIHGKMFLYKDEWTRVTAIRDITERKKAEEALKEANKQLERLALQDGLTGIANRRSFNTKMKNEWLRMSRERKPLSIFLFDVDFFKLYNDTYGHQAGDVCLQEIVKGALPFLKRPGDLFARYGGEEFVAVLPDTDGKGAAHLAEQVRNGIYELKIPHDASKICEHVTVSCGVASLVPSEATTPEDLLKASDKALYEAKEAGRNRVVLKILD